MVASCLYSVIQKVVPKTKFEWSEAAATAVAATSSVPMCLEFSHRITDIKQVRQIIRNDN